MLLVVSTDNIVNSWWGSWSTHERSGLRGILVWTYIQGSVTVENFRHYTSHVHMSSLLVHMLLVTSWCMCQMCTSCILYSTFTGTDSTWWPTKHIGHDIIEKQCVAIQKCKEIHEVVQNLPAFVLRWTSGKDVSQKDMDSVGMWDITGITVLTMLELLHNPRNFKFFCNFGYYF